MRIWTALLLLLVATSLHGQTKLTDADVGASLIFAENQVRLNLADISLDSPMLTPLFAMQFEGSGDSRSASAIGGWFLCGKEKDPAKCLASDPLGVHAKLSTPIAEKAKSANLLNIHGFDGKTSLQFAAKWSNAAREVQKAMRKNKVQQDFGEALSIRLAANQSLAARVLHAAPAAGDLQATLTNAAAPRADERWSADAATGVLQAIAAAAALDEEGGRSELVDLIARSLRTSDVKDPDSPLRGRWATPYFASFVFTTARPTFKFADSAFADQKEQHPVYAGSVLFGLTPLIGLDRDARFYVGVSHTYKVDYKEKDSTEICTPLDSSTTLRCRTIALGAPARKLQHITQAEYRRFFRHVGFNPKASYDWDSGAYGFELPIYLRQDVIGNFGGGVKATWDSNNREFAAVVFVSAFPGVKLPGQ